MQQFLNIFLDQSSLLLSTKLFNSSDISCESELLRKLRPDRNCVKKSYKPNNNQSQKFATFKFLFFAFASRQVLRHILVYNHNFYILQNESCIHTMYTNFLPKNFRSNLPSEILKFRGRDKSVASNSLQTQFRKFYRSNSSFSAIFTTH